MESDGPLADRFEEHRTRLRAAAYRMLGSQSDAEDAVQEAWIRASRSGASGIENLGGWLTTIVARVCLDMLRSRRSRPEDPIGESAVEAIATSESGTDPEYEALLADSVGIALLVVLESLTPPERVAFVLHDMFAVPFDDIAPIVGRSAAATRQLASRGRRRVQGRADVANLDFARQREVVGAFFAASRGGEFHALLALLDPGVVMHSDQAASSQGAPAEVRGAEAVAATFSGRARAAQLALVNGAVGLVWAVRGKPRVVFTFTISAEKIVAINLTADPQSLARLDIVTMRADPA